MDSRLLAPAPVSGRPSGPGGATQWLRALDQALAGVGPALLPVPDQALAPAAVRGRLLEAMQLAEPLERPDIALVVPTSGSTGQPKGALLTSAAVLASASATRSRLGGAGTWVLALPLTHVAGQMVLARSLDSGTEPFALDLSGGFDPAHFGALTRQARTATSGALFTSLVPAQLALVLEQGIDVDAYDAILLGGGAAGVPLLTAAAEAGATVVTTYGMSETCGGCVYDGRPLEGVDLAIDRAGRIRIFGPIVFAGYRGRPDLTEASLSDGGFLTADLGRLDAGRLTVLGRADDVIVSGGVNVPAGLVAMTLSAHPGVRACAVVGVGDPVWGQRVVAVVEPVEDARPTLAELRAFALPLLEAAAVPRGLVLVPTLPLLAPGKPDREKIQVLADATRAGEVGNANLHREES